MEKIKSTFVYGERLLIFLLDYYFSGGMTGDYDRQVIKIGGRNSGFEGMSAMKADIARALKILELEEKVVLALRHSGHTFYEITKVIRRSKGDTINIYRSGLIRMLMYLNGPG